MNICLPFTTEEPIVQPELAAWANHLPEIERRLSEFAPDALVCGLGPSARLLSSVNPLLLANVRIWGVNDFFSIMPCHDLVIMDSPDVPHSGLRHIARGTTVNPRWTTVVNSKPDRWWLYHEVAKLWTRLIPPSSTVKIFELRNWMWPKDVWPMPELEHRPYDHTAASPVGATAMAWGEGARKIGLLGIDLLVDDNGRPQHHMSLQKSLLSWFLSHFNYQAQKKDGEIRNLSPFSRLNVNKFKNKEPSRAIK